MGAQHNSAARVKRSNCKGGRSAGDDDDKVCLIIIIVSNVRAAVAAAAPGLNVKYAYKLPAPRAAITVTSSVNLRGGTCVGYAAAAAAAGRVRRCG